MKTTKNIIALILLVFIGLSANMQAERKQYYSLGWEVSMPIGSFSDYISETSLRGGYFSGNIFVSDNVSVGFKFGYNSFYENAPRQIHYIDDGLAVTAASYNYMTTAPMQLGAYYHIDGGAVEPYLGIGLGINYITEETTVQDLYNYDDQWAFLVNPEIGLRYKVPNTTIGFVLRVGYNYNINSYEVWGKKYDNLQNVNFGLGLSWTVR